MAALKGDAKKEKNLDGAYRNGPTNILFTYPSMYLGYDQSNSCFIFTNSQQDAEAPAYQWYLDYVSVFHSVRIAWVPNSTSFITMSATGVSCAPTGNAAYVDESLFTMTDTGDGRRWFLSIDFTPPKWLCIGPNSGTLKPTSSEVPRRIMCFPVPGTSEYMSFGTKLDLPSSVMGRIESNHVTVSELCELNRDELHLYCVNECRMTTKEYLIVKKELEGIKTSMVYKEKIIHDHSFAMASSGSLKSIESGPPLKKKRAMKKKRRIPDPHAPPSKGDCDVDPGGPYYLHFTNSDKYVGYNDGFIVRDGPSISAMNRFKWDITTTEESGVTYKKLSRFESSSEHIRLADGAAQVTLESVPSNFVWTANSGGGNVGKLTIGSPSKWLRVGGSPDKFGKRDTESVTCNMKITNTTPS